MPVNPPTITISDNGDGTVAVVVSGATTGTTNQFRYSDVEGVSWTNSGTPITGNGTILAAPVPNGSWWGTVSSTLGGESAYAPPVGFVAYDTGGDSDDAYQQSILLAVQGRIQALALPGIPADHVVVQPAQYQRYNDLPAVVITPGPSEQIAPSEGTNARDDVWYPVTVALWAPSQQHLDTQAAQFYSWRQRIVQALAKQRLPGVPDVATCQVQPLAILDPNLFISKTLLAGGLQLNFRVRQRRGLNP